MCYSAQVIQMARKLHRRLGIRLDYDEVERLFFRRLEDPGINISRGFEANFADPGNDQERRVKGAIDQYRSRLATRYEKDLFSQKTRLVTAERSLLDKETKKAREDVRIASNKIEMLTSKLSDLRRTEPNAQDNRVFPMVYAGVIRHRQARRSKPAHSRCAISAGPRASPRPTTRSFPACTAPGGNNLEKFWAEQFGHHHAVMAVESFYEKRQVARL